jgi:hypothetical protein
MFLLLMGGLGALILLGGVKAFADAPVATVKSFLLWTLALAGATLAGLLLLTGKGGIALFALTAFGPLIWDRVRDRLGFSRPQAGARPGGRPAGRAAAPRGGMSREEAWQVLGLQPGASAAQVQEAYVRLMRAAHPDGGGSDWLAARINQARDVLLG